MAKVEGTIVAKPQRSEDMLESILCCVLRFALTRPEHDRARAGAHWHGVNLMQKRVRDKEGMLAAAKLYPGGEFEVDASKLAPPDKTFEGETMFLQASVKERLASCQESS